MVVSILIASILAVVFIAFRVTFAKKSNQMGVVGVLLKTLASLGFMAIAFTAIVMGGINKDGVHIPSAIFIVGGLIMGLIGDIVLDLKVVYLHSKEEGVYLTGGMASFAIGHILYFVALILYFGFKVISWPIIGICVAVAAVVAFAMVFGGEKLMKLNFGNFTIHSIVYAFLLLFMAALGVAVWVKGAGVNSHVPVFSVGMILFLLSDVVLTQMYFGGRAKDDTLCVINHALYYAAQICIATFVFFM